MANLFVYGTLMEQSRLHEITGKQFSTSPATLKDFRKLNSHLGHPYILSDKGSKIEGLVIKDVDEQSLKKLDRYEAEGRLYFRKQVQVVAAGEEISCETYVGNPKFLRPRP